MLGEDFNRLDGGAADVACAAGSAACAAGKLGSEPKFSRLNADPAGASLRCAEKLRSDPNLPTATNSPTDPDLPDPKLPKSWNSTRLPSHWARMTTRIESSAPRMSAKAGRGVNARRSMVVRLSLALRPRCLAARSRSSGCSASVGDRPSWCAKVAGSAGVWCRRAMAHRAARADRRGRWSGRGRWLGGRAKQSVGGHARALRWMCNVMVQLPGVQGARWVVRDAPSWVTFDGGEV